MSAIDVTAVGIQAPAPDKPLQPVRFTRHQPGPRDIVFKVKYCGICHSDIHIARAEMGDGMHKFPITPGHEIAGVVEHVGEEVTKFAAGDHIGVGCIVDSCLDCEYCHQGDEQYCSNGVTWTYGSDPKHGRAGPTGSATRGGYSSRMVIDERFAVKLPKSLPLESVGPILCAGITMYDPLVHWKAGSEHVKKVGIIGGGGLGHMGIKLAKALGCEVTAFTTSPGKAEHLKALGAEHVVVSTDAEAMNAASRSLDLVLNTIPSKHEVSVYVPTLRPNGTIVQLGLVPDKHQVSQLPLVFYRQAIAGSCVGGIQTTQDLVDLCAKENIVPEVEVVPCSKVNDIWHELSTKNTLPRRYVLDIDSTMEDYAKTSGL